MALSTPHCLQCSDAVCEALYADTVSLWKKLGDIFEKIDAVSFRLRDPTVDAGCILLNVNCDKKEKLKNEQKQLSEEANETGKEARIVHSYLNMCA